MPKQCFLPDGDLRAVSANFRSVIIPACAFAAGVLPPSLCDMPDFELRLVDLRSVQGRRFNLQPRALEFFSIDQRNYLVTFPSTAARDAAFEAVVGQYTPHITYRHIRSGASLFKKSDLTRRWQQRQITNFEYLIQVWAKV